MRECVTHHICDCLRAKINKLQTENKKQSYVLDMCAKDSAKIIQLMALLRECAETDIPEYLHAKIEEALK